MNPQQMKYARERINQIHSRKSSELQNKFKPETLSEDKILDALANHNFTVRDKVDNNYFSGIRNYVIFDEETQVDEKQYKKELQALNEMKYRMLDELMLGDSEQALKSLKEFENYGV